MDLLFKNICLVPMTDEKVIYDACVGVEGAKIRYAGVEKPELPANRIIDGTDKLLMPGLYNCHSHIPMSLLRGYAGDLNLQTWLFDYIFPAERKITADMVYAGSMISIAEMIASGTVAFTDMYFELESIAKAIDETGVKANISNAMTAFSEDYDYRKDRSYLESAAILMSYYNKDNKANGRIKLDAGIHAEFTSFDRAWRQVVEFAQANNLNMHVHLSETKTEHENCKKKYGKTPARVLAEHGVFDTRTTAAHCTWVEYEDMDILCEKGVSVAYNPVSNLKLASGIARIHDMLTKNINVTIGTDGVSSNNSQDLFADLKLASLLQKYLTNDPTALPAYELLKLATVNGAKAQGRENSGQIRQGFDADLIMLDMNNPRQVACIDPIANLAYSCSGQDVELTMCQGKILYEHGEYKTLDIERVLAMGKKAAADLKLA
ncbi:MAG: amidohydrolase [Clostridiales bacterium]|jgi:5-methylthioadenosine/S-adenosylhomocysteine deaminase|nr:amidohydrolase [Clostridiales bacterium]